MGSLLCCNNEFYVKTEDILSAFTVCLFSSKRFCAVWLAALTQENPAVSCNVQVCEALYERGLHEGESV